MERSWEKHSLAKGGKRMIEKFTSDELNIIRKEMIAHGYISVNTTKAYLLEQAKKRVGIIPYISPEVKKGMYDIADNITNNYTIRKSKSCGVDRNCKNHHVPDEIQEKYLEVLMELCKALKPYINKYLEGLQEVYK